MVKARVILKGAKTYNLGGKRWIKDVPGIVKGAEQVEAYKQNGFFHVHVLKSAPEPDEDEAPKPKKKVKKGTKLKKD